MTYIVEVTIRCFFCHEATTIVGYNGYGQVYKCLNWHCRKMWRLIAEEVKCEPKTSESS